MSSIASPTFRLAFPNVSRVFPGGFIRHALVVQVGVVRQIAHRLLDLPLTDSALPLSSS
jgi:hypothetical protein